MHISPMTAAMAFLLVVLFVAAFGRLWIAVTVAIASALALNFFFLPPIGTFTIADPENWVALIAFLIVGILASNLSAAAQARADEAARGALASTLLASLSHDLRTPLTAIRVAVENLRQEDVPPDHRREQVGAALSELDRLTQLFQDILDMARIDAQAITPDRQWVTPADVVDAAAAHVRHALEGRTLKVDADFDAEVDIDPRLVSAALAHLLQNAAQYSPPGQPIMVTAHATREGLEVSVTDGGPGLDSSDLDHVFERFYRGRTARQSSFGTGMGLAITRGLLAAASGRVWAENAAGGGARFSIVVSGPRRAVAVME